MATRGGGGRPRHACRLAGFTEALVAPGPSAELGAAANDFGWLEGGWNAEIRDFDADGQVRRGSGEWWFAWVLEGRAMQDVWIAPRRGERAGPRGPMEADDRYGTTIRRFDRAGGLWTIVWINPVSGTMDQLVGRRQGDRIVLLGEKNGVPVRWSFLDIRADNFTWRGEAQQSGGALDDGRGVQPVAHGVAVRLKGDPMDKAQAVPGNQDRTLMMHDDTAYGSKITRWALIKLATLPARAWSVAARTTLPIVGHAADWYRRRRRRRRDIHAGLMFRAAVRQRAACRWQAHQAGDRSGRSHVAIGQGHRVGAEPCLAAGDRSGP